MTDRLHTLIQELRSHGDKDDAEAIEELIRDRDNETGHREACHEEYVRACAERDTAYAKVRHLLANRDGRRRCQIPEHRKQLRHLLHENRHIWGLYLASRAGYRDKYLVLPQPEQARLIDAEQEATRRAALAETELAAARAEVARLRRLLASVTPHTSRKVLDEIDAALAAQEGA